MSEVVNPYDQMRSAMRAARAQLGAADTVANDLAELLEGRLRKVSVYRLQKLKRELKGFNAKTKVWD